MRYCSSDQWLTCFVLAFHAQLPVRLSFCASARYVSLRRRASSVRLRSVTSRAVPHQRAGRPEASRTHTPMCCIQRTSPWTIARTSMLRREPVPAKSSAIARCHFSRSSRTRGVRAR